MIAPAKSDRDALILSHLYIPGMVARKMCRRLPPSVDREDLESAGMLGLIHAATRFDPARHVKFRTYAWRKVFGAIGDWLRELDWIPQSRRLAERQRNEGPARCRPGWERDIPEVVSLGSSVAMGGQSEKFPDHSAGPDQIAEVRDFAAMVLGKLKSRDRAIIDALFFHELNQRETGELLGVGESFISQMRDKILENVRHGIFFREKAKFVTGSGRKVRIGQRALARKKIRSILAKCGPLSRPRTFKIMRTTPDFTFFIVHKQMCDRGELVQVGTEKSYNRTCAVWALA